MPRDGDLISNARFANHDLARIARSDGSLNRRSAIMRGSVWNCQFGLSNTTTLVQTDLNVIAACIAHIISARRWPFRWRFRSKSAGESESLMTSEIAGDKRPKSSATNRSSAKAKAGSNPASAAGANPELLEEAPSSTLEAGIGSFSGNDGTDANPNGASKASSRDPSQCTRCHRGGGPQHIRACGSRQSPALKIK